MNTPVKFRIYRFSKVVNPGKPRAFWGGGGGEIHSSENNSVPEYVDPATCTRCTKNPRNTLNANSVKWSNTLKQFLWQQPTNRLSVFDRFVGLALKGLNIQI